MVDWIQFASLMVLLLAFVGGVTIAAHYLKSALLFDTQPQQRARKNTTVTGDRGEESQTERALRIQAELAAKQRAFADRDAIGETFLHVAAKRLCELWSGFTYEEARSYVRSWLTNAGIVFLDSDYDWSESTAREIAETIAQEDGERYGDNG